MKKLKLLPVLFLILLSGQVQAETWEESMTTWAGIWKKVYSADNDVSEQGRNEMTEQCKDRTRFDPNYTYEQRKYRLIEYAKKHINTHYPDMTTSTTSDVINWIAKWYRAIIKHPMASENPSEAMLLDDESWLIYKYPTEIANIVARQAKKAKQAEQARREEVERRAKLAIPELEVKAPVAGVEWVSKHKTFDYLLPCSTGIPYAAIVTHGANRMDSLTDNGEGELTHERDMAIGYPRMVDFCVAIAVPKSGLSTTYNEYDEAQEWRTWWMTEGVEDENGVPVRDEEEEMQATIKLIKSAKGALRGTPVYLVIGNDLGKSAVKIFNKLGEDGEIDAIDGFIYVNRETGEFSRYDSDGTVWKSEDNTTPE